MEISTPISRTESVASYVAVARFGLASLLALAGAACSSPDFEDGFEDPGDISDLWQLDMHDNCTMVSIDTPVREGNRALQISAKPGLRCELVPRQFGTLQSKFRREPFGEERWYRFSTRVGMKDAAGDPNDLGDNTIIAQWHSSPDPFFGSEQGRGPPLALRIHDGRWGITYGWDTKLRSTERHMAGNWQWAGPVEVNQWVDWTFRVVWSHEEDGITEVWKDGIVIMRRSGPNAFNDFRGVYLKLGIYHPPSDQVLVLDRVSVRSQE